MKRGWIAFFLFSLIAINYVDRLMPALAAFVTTGMMMLVGSTSALALANTHPDQHGRDGVRV